VLDDLHWASQGTVLLLRHVIRSTRRARLLIIANYRDTDLPHPHALRDALADLHTEPTVQRVALGGLDAGAAHALVRAAGSDLDDTARGWVAAVHARSNGNPLFMTELVRHLDELGVLRPGRPTGELELTSIGIPASVRAMIDRRLGRLSDTASEALQIAAVIGTDFRFTLLAQVSGLGEKILLAALAQAASARLVEETGPGSYRFAQSLVRDTLYDELGATRRARLHRRVAETLEAMLGRGLKPNLAALAFHYAQAAAEGETVEGFAYASGTP